VTKASELPFPEYWKGLTVYLTFHAPHLGEGFMRELIFDYVRVVIDAEKKGVVPQAPVVPEAVRAIWRKADRTPARSQMRREDAWNNAAERAMQVRNRFTEGNLF
jgi:hypothetical protein